MTIPEINSLKRELEDAMLQAFTDFERISGISIVAVDLTSVSHHYVAQRAPVRTLTNVTVQLEIL